MQKKENDNTIKFDEKSSDTKKKQYKEPKKPGIVIKGEKNLMARFAKCCNPVPGDDVIGFITKGRGVSVHRKDCKNFEHLAAVEPERVVEAKWSGVGTADFLADIRIEANDRYGLLSELTSVVANSNTTVMAVNARTNRSHIAIISLTVQISDVDQLDKLMNSFRRVHGVFEVYRNKN